MFKLSNFVAATLMVSPVASVLTESAEAVIVRYRTVLEDNDGNTSFEFPGSSLAAATVIGQDTSGATSFQEPGNFSFSFDFDTERNGRITNFLIFGRGIGGPTISIQQGELTTPTGEIIPLGDNLSGQFPVPGSPPGVPVTRMTFIGGNGSITAFNSFILELEADFDGLAAGGRVDISPFDPAVVLDLDFASQDQDLVTPLQLRTLSGPISRFAPTERTGTFGFFNDNFQFFGGPTGAAARHTIGPTAENLNNSPFGQIYLWGEVVPEPSSLALLAASGLLMAGRRRRCDACG